MTKDEFRLAALDLLSRGFSDGSHLRDEINRGLRIPPPRNPRELWRTICGKRTDPRLGVIDFYRLMNAAENDRLVASRDSRGGERIFTITEKGQRERACLRRAANQHTIGPIRF